MLHAMPRVVLIGGSIAAAGLLLGAAVKPELDDRTHAVANDWSPVAAAENHRAQALGALDALLARRGATHLAAAGRQAIADWNGASSGVIAAQIAAANEVESETARALALAATPPYSSDAAIVQTASELRFAAPAPSAVASLDRAVASENAVGNNALRRFVVGLAGHEHVPEFIAAS